MSLQHYRCDHCGHVFADGDGGRTRDHLGVTEPYPVYVWFTCCPECRCTDLEAITVCDGCGEAEILPGEMLCPACIKENA